MRYFAKRAAHSIALLIGVSVLCFVLSDLAPGSFFDEMQMNPQISPETIAGLRSQYGLNRPLPVRYARWVKSVMRGEWGYSFAYNSPVRNLLVTRARNTLLLTSLSTALAWLLSVPIGVWLGSRAGHWEDRVGLAGSSLLLSVPELVLVLALLGLAIRTHWLPVGGMASVGSAPAALPGKVFDLVAHLVIPVVVLVLATLPILVRHVRSSMMEALSAPFIQVARAHGIGRMRLLFRFALPAAANPLISLFGLSIAGLLSGSVLVEVVTGWPGLGPLLLESSMAKDLYVVVGIVMLSTIFMVLGSLLADVLLFAVDPRVRAE